MSNHPSVTDCLEAGLKAAAVRSAVIANNLANLQTPGFRRSKVEFEMYLSQALDGGGPIDLDEIQPHIFQPLDTPVDSNGNDVNLEVEIGAMIKGSAKYKTYMRLLSKLYQQMELAIRTD